MMPMPMSEGKHGPATRATATVLALLVALALALSLGAPGLGWAVMSAILIVAACLRRTVGWRTLLALIGAFLGHAAWLGPLSAPLDAVNRVSAPAMVLVPFAIAATGIAWRWRSDRSDGRAGT